MTVYTDNPFGGFGGGMRNPRMPRPPMNQPQMPPMNQMPRRMPGGPSKGGTTSIPMRRPPMQRPGGPGKGRIRGGLMRRGRGRPMPGGPGKGRGQMQQPMPQPNVGQRRTQGPINMPPMDFPQPESFNNPIIGRPMPQPSGFDRGSFGQMGPPSNIQFQQVGNNRPLPSFMGRVANNMPEAPFNAYNRPMGRVGNNMPRLQRPLPSNMEYGMGFYGGGITDLY